MKYKSNQQMLELARSNDVSFENNYNECRLSKELRYFLNEGIRENYKNGDIYYCYSEDNFGYFYDDLTGNETSNNKVVFDRCKSDKLTLKKAISFCHKLSCLLPDYHDFKIIMSIDDSYVSISFHMVREGESWLMDDLEEYKQEAILVMEKKAVC